MRHGLVLMFLIGLGGCGGVEGSPPAASSAPATVQTTKPESAGPANSPCRLDGDGNECVRGADLCRYRGGTVYSDLSCNDPNLVCCFL